MRKRILLILHNTQPKGIEMLHTHENHTIYKYVNRKNMFYYLSFLLSLAVITFITVMWIFFRPKEQGSPEILIFKIVVSVIFILGAMIIIIFTVWNIGCIRNTNFSIIVFTTGERCYRMRWVPITGRESCPGCGANEGQLHVPCCNFESCPLCEDLLPTCVHGYSFAERDSKA